MKSLFVKNPQEKKRKFRLPLNAYLLYLLVATLLFTGVSFSKFASSGAGSDSARVALMVASATGQVTSEDYIVDGSGVTGEPEFEYSVMVSNAENGQVAEVALQYWIVIRVGEEFPTDTLNIQVSDAVKDETRSNSRELFFLSSQPLLAGTETSNTHVITVLTTDATLRNYEDQQIEIAVIAEQID